VPGYPTRHSNVDFVVVRENTEGEYSGMEHAAVQGRVVESLKIMTREKSERIARFAFDFAKKNNRKVRALVSSYLGARLTSGHRKSPASTRPTS
jgi:isocitrate/isopropylmalate dehydrogenase